MGSLLKSTLNTRELPVGNYRYLRSDCPDKITRDEINWLKKNNILTIVDLRDESECLKRNCILEEEEGFTYYHMPVTGGGAVPDSVEAVKESYIKMVDDKMYKIVDAIMNAETNVLYFCNAGKDRTGVVSAIILKKLGFEEDVIIDDYMRSKDNLMGFLKEFCDAHPDVDLNIVTPQELYIKSILLGD